MEGIYDFSAIAKHLAASKPDIELRHQAYLDALKSTGVHVTLANFKAREKFVPLKYCRFRIGRSKRRLRVPIPRCSLSYIKAEEKETDVAIASKMFELLHRRVPSENRLRGSATGT